MGYLAHREGDLHFIIKTNEHGQRKVGEEFGVWNCPLLSIKFCAKLHGEGASCGRGPGGFSANCSLVDFVRLSRLLALIPGHIFLGIWLVRRSPASQGKPASQ